MEIPEVSVRLPMDHWATVLDLVKGKKVEISSFRAEPGSLYKEVLQEQSDILSNIAAQIEAELPI